MTENNMIKPGDIVRVKTGLSWRGEYKVIRLAKLGRVPAAVIDTGEYYTRTFPITSLEKMISADR